MNFITAGKVTTEKEKSDLDVGITISTTLADSEEKFVLDDPNLSTTLLKYITAQTKVIGRIDNLPSRFVEAFLMKKKFNYLTRRERKVLFPHLREAALVTFWQTKVNLFNREKRTNKDLQIKWPGFNLASKNVTEIF